LATPDRDAILHEAVGHRGHLDVTTGRVVVVVGGRLVAGVVGGVLVVGGVMGGGTVVGVVGVVVGVLVVGTRDGTGPFGLAEDPGCSFATVRPIHAVAPPAWAIVVVVNRRTRVCARSRSAGELPPRVRLTVIANGVGPASALGR
jgi:hypothetical protein